MYTIKVYMVEGYYKYQVDAINRAYHHAQAILDTGYRHTTPGVTHLYPPQKILKVVIEGEGITTEYPDEFCRT